MGFGEPREIPIDSRMIWESAIHTIKSPIDAAVELITNCDDSYRRLEEQGIEAKGKIELFVSRRAAGFCEDFGVRDYAEGMTGEELEEAIKFGVEASGFKEGRTVRGLFGRGLKEAIIALGEGEVYTIKNNTLNAAKIWRGDGKAWYCLDDEVQNAPGELRHDIGIEQGNGTLVKISVKNIRMKIRELDYFKQQLSDHYALRGINSSDKREVSLTFEDRKRNLTTRNIKISFNSPKGDIVYNSKVKLPGYSDMVKIKVFKSPVPLESPRLSPFAKAGILIKTEASILDNQLFKYDNDLAALYFFGEAYCEGMTERIKEGETGIIDFNRGGIEWDHYYCKAIQATIEKILDPLIQEKRKELEKREEKKEVAEPTKKMLRKLCDLLNELAKKEFEEWETPVGEPTEEIKELTILPRSAYIEVDKPRSFGVYAPTELVRLAGNKVALKSNNINIQLLSSQASLGKHSNKHPNLYYGVFKIVGRVDDEEADIHCKLNGQKAMAHVKVHKLGKKPPNGGGRKGGFIRDITPDPTLNPIQRVEYKEDTGEIKVYTMFPVVARYFGANLEGAETEQGKVILAELVGEAFCRKLADRKLKETGSPFPGAEIEAFNSTVNELQKKYLDKIHGVVASWKFK